MTTITRLRSFVRLADLGSVREAARALVVTESTVSAAVTALSHEIGVALVARDGRGVALTPAGERYADYARRILGLHDEAVAAARAEADPEHGRVRLAAVTTAGEHVVPGLLASFRAQHPDIELRLEVRPRDEVWPLLSRHDVDVVVAGRPPDEMLAAVRATCPNTLVVVGATTAHTAATPFTPYSATWLLREPGSGTRATCLAVLSALDAHPSLLTLGSHGAAVAAAVAGLGVTLVSRQSVAAQLRAGSLIELAVPDTPLQRPWHVVTNPRPTATTELLLTHLRGQPGWTLHR